MPRRLLWLVAVIAAGLLLGGGFGVAWRIAHGADRRALTRMEMELVQLRARADAELAALQNLDVALEQAERDAQEAQLALERAVRARPAGPRDLTRPDFAELVATCAARDGERDACGARHDMAHAAYLATIAEHNRLVAQAHAIWRRINAPHLLFRTAPEGLETVPHAPAPARR